MFLNKHHTGNDYLLLPDLATGRIEDNPYKNIEWYCAPIKMFVRLGQSLMGMAVCTVPFDVLIWVVFDTARCKIGEQRIVIPCVMLVKKQLVLILTQVVETLITLIAFDRC